MGDGHIVWKQHATMTKIEFSISRLHDIRLDSIHLAQQVAPDFSA
jgi:hypothetical protein